ncbi:unnamed protein product [Rhizophagus irregularis]|nr:unnamed protein product [Rhizophagus irregularis]
MLKNIFLKSWSRIITVISILRNISFGLMVVHGSNFIHRDFHSGNILSGDAKSSVITDYNRFLSVRLREKPHPKAIYTSRSINSYISKCSSILSKYSSITTNFSSKDYTSKDLEFDIDIKSELSVIGTKRNIEELNINSYENSNEKRIKTSSS